MLNLSPFSTATLPRIRFGEGTLAELPQLLLPFGKRVLLLTGGSSFTQSRFWAPLQKGLREKGIDAIHESISGEPSPQRVDELVAAHFNSGISAVVGIGGGSVLDTAKAVAGLLPFGNSVLDHLEDVGRGLPYNGPALPFIAVPTTAGTGSEVTRNAVLSEHGTNGYKKSFRHDSLVARVALVDPLLLEGCSPALIAAQGMDAFTQLLESYVSLRANPFTDAMAWSGLEAVHEGFVGAYQGEAPGRAAMAYAALISGITLAQVGLGSVHGLAQPLGSLFPLPHGVACGTMVAQATRINIKALRQRLPQSPALAKYARVGRLLSDSTVLNATEAHEALLGVLEAWREEMNMPRLGDYGIGEGDIPVIVANSRNNSMKTNPIELSDEEIAALVRARI
jgi:alcohol dehydrogenase class IV